MRICSCTILFLCCTLALNAQFMDAGLWADTKLAANYKKKWQFAVSPEIRLDENLQRIARLFSDFSIEYKLSKKIFFNATYRGGVRNTGEWFELRQRVQLAVGLRFKTNDFTFTYLPRYQLNLLPGSQDTDADFSSTIRNKISAKYSGMKKTDFSTSVEIFNSSGRYSAFILQTWRCTAEIERKLNKRNSIGLGYLIQKSLLDSPQRIDFVFLCSYQFNFNLFKKSADAENTLPSSR